MSFLTDPTAPDDTSIVSQEDPFITWYRGQQQPDPTSGEIQMDAVDARPTIGFPHVPDAAPPPSIPPPDAATAMQPGLGLPASAIDQAIGAPPLPPVDHGQAVYTPDIPGAPDAISGSAGTFAMPPAESTAQPLAAPLTPEQRARQFAADSPEEQAKHEYAFAQAQQAEDNRRRTRAALEDEQRAYEDHIQIRDAQEMARRKTAQLDEDTRKLAETEIDPSWHASIGKRAIGVIGAVIAGFAQNANGGPNIMLQSIDGEIDRSIDAQKANLANKRASLAARGASIQQQLALAGDINQESEKYRIASYARIQNMITNEMQQYDPAGKTAIELGKAYTQIGQQRSAALVAFQDKQFTDYKDALKVAAEQRKYDDEHRKSMLESQKLAGQLGGGGGVAKPAKPEDIIKTPEQWAAEGIPGVPHAMSAKDLKSWQPLKKGSQEITANESQGMSKEELERSIPGLRQSDGKPFVAVGDPTAIEKLRKQKVSTESAVDLMDQALVTRTGWSSDIGNSKERAELKTIWGQATVEVKDLYDLGAITKSDEGLIIGVLGTDDPSSWKDPTNAIKKARELLLNRLNKNLKGHGYTGEKYTVRQLPEEGATKTPDDNAMEEVLSDERGLPIARLAGELDATPEDLTGNLSGLWRKYHEAGGLLPSHRKVLDRLAVEMKGSDAEKAKLASARLTDAANKAQSTGVREYAKQLLDVSIAAGIHNDETRDPSVGKATAYEAAPPMLTPQPKGTAR